MKALLTATSLTLRKPKNVPTIFWNNAGRSTLGHAGDDDDDGDALPVLSEHWNANLPTGSISPSLLCLCRSIQQPNVLLIIKLHLLNMVIIIFETWSSLSLKHHYLINHHHPNPHDNKLAPNDTRTKSLTHHPESAHGSLLCLNVYYTFLSSFHCNLCLGLASYLFWSGLVFIMSVRYV